MTKNGYISAVTGLFKAMFSHAVATCHIRAQTSTFNISNKGLCVLEQGNVAEILPLLTHHSAKLLWQAPEGTNVKSKAL